MVVSVFLMLVLLEELEHQHFCVSTLLSFFCNFSSIEFVSFWVRQSRQRLIVLWSAAQAHTASHFLSSEWNPAFGKLRSFTDPRSANRLPRVIKMWVSEMVITRGFRVLDHMFLCLDLPWKTIWVWHVAEWNVTYIKLIYLLQLFHMHLQNMWYVSGACPGTTGVHPKRNSLCLQWFLLKTTESVLCTPASNNYDTDVPVKVASGLCFLISAHTWLLSLGFKQLLSFQKREKQAR